MARFTIRGDERQSDFQVTEESYRLQDQDFT